MHNIILSYTISNYTINHIKSSYIIKWLTVIQTRREREKITKWNTNRLIEWKKENRMRVRVWDKMKTLEERKTEEIQKSKNEKIKKNIEICEKLKRGIS